MRLIVFFIMMVLSGFAFAGVWTPLQSISEIRESGNGTSVYGHDLSDPAINCPNLSAALPSPDLTDAQINRMNSIILSAFVSGKAIQLKINDGACFGDYPFYYAVRMR